MDGAHTVSGTAPDEEAPAERAATERSREARKRRLLGAYLKRAFVADDQERQRIERDVRRSGGMRVLARDARAHAARAAAYENAAAKSAADATKGAR